MREKKNFNHVNKKKNAPSNEDDESNQRPDEGSIDVVREIWMSAGELRSFVVVYGACEPQQR